MTMFQRFCRPTFSSRLRRVRSAMLFLFSGLSSGMLTSYWNWSSLLVFPWWSCRSFEWWSHMSTRFLMNLRIRCDLHNMFSRLVDLFTLLTMFTFFAVSISVFHFLIFLLRIAAWSSLHRAISFSSSRSSSWRATNSMFMAACRIAIDGYKILDLLDFTLSGSINNNSNLDTFCTTLQYQFGIFTFRIG